MNGHLYAKCASFSINLSLTVDSHRVDCLKHLTVRGPKMLWFINRKKMTARGWWKISNTWSAFSHQRIVIKGNTLRSTTTEKLILLFTIRLSYLYVDYRSIKEIQNSSQKIGYVATSILKILFNRLPSFFLSSLHKEKIFHLYALNLNRN